MIDTDALVQLSKIGLTGLFYVTTLIFIIFSLSIVYHWMAYGIHKVRITIMMVTYLSISALLFIAMAFSLNYLL